jgi:hypothetical protein
VTDPSRHSTSGGVSRNTFDGPTGMQSGGNNTQFNFLSNPPTEEGGVRRKNLALSAAVGALLISATVLTVMKTTSDSGNRAPDGRHDGPVFVDSQLALAANSDLCVDVDKNMPVDGVKIQLWDCASPARGQLWTLNSDGTLQAYGKKCLNVPGPRFAEETRVELGECGERPGRKWRYNAQTKRLEATEEGHPTLCLDVPRGNSVNGTALQVYHCMKNVPATQQWYVKSS